jgi:hypothetical protein
LNNPLFSTIYNWQHWSIWQAGSEHDNYLQWAILERQLCLCSLIFAAFWKINHALNYINHLFPSYDIIIDFWLYDYRCTTTRLDRDQCLSDAYCAEATCCVSAETWSSQIATADGICLPSWALKLLILWRN